MVNYFLVSSTLLQAKESFHRVVKVQYIFTKIHKLILLISFH